MYQYIVKHLLLMVPTLMGAAIVVFFLLRMIPGDICELRMAGEGGYFDAEALATCRENLGIDKTIMLQFLDFIWGFVRFDLGTSMWTEQPIGNSAASCGCMRSAVFPSRRTSSSRCGGTASYCTAPR